MLPAPLTPLPMLVDDPGRAALAAEGHRLAGHENFDHVWFWRARLPERKGHVCRVVARGRMNSILVEFEDGKRFVTSRYAVRKKPIIEGQSLGGYEVDQRPSGHPCVNELDHASDPDTAEWHMVHPPLVKAAEER